MARARAVPDLDAGDELRTAAGKVVATRASELFDHADGVLDLSDTERVHDMRVASRRLRAVLEMFAPCWPRKRHRRALRAVKALADALGERRDPDVQLAALRQLRADAPPPTWRGIDDLLAELSAEQAAANERLAAALEAAARDDLRGQLDELVTRAAKR